jgi:hypothetical protein
MGTAEHQTPENGEIMIIQVYININDKSARFSTLRITAIWRSRLFVQDVTKMGVIVYRDIHN